MAPTMQDANAMAGAKDYRVEPRFHSKSVQLDFKSREAGRPIFEDQEFVTIVIPGLRTVMLDERVSDEHRTRWPEQYAAFKAGREAPLEGTPLREWPVGAMTASKADELAYFHIRTVEQLAALGDDKLQNLGMGSRELRERARVWLDVAKNGGAALEKMQATIERLSADVARLTSSLTASNSENQRLSVLATQSQERPHDGA